MLTCGIRRSSPAVFITVVLLVLWQPAAHAAGEPSGGGPFGTVQCGQAFTPSCVVSAGSPGSLSTAGTTAAALSGLGSGTTAAGGGCVGRVSAEFGCVPPGCQITVAAVGCPLGLPGPTGAPVAAPPSPGALAEFAVRYLRLPSPVIRSSPTPGDLQLVYLPVWLWVNPAVWAPVSKTASVPGERVTVTATPVSMSWRMGDGATVTCDGPGAPYLGTDDPAAASPDCGYTYTTSSAGQPGGAFRVTATITWRIRWTAGGGVAGTLPPLFTAAAVAFRVAESQAINISGGQG